MEKSDSGSVRTFLTEAGSNPFPAEENDAPLHLRSQGIHELFEAQARTTPDRIALVYGDRCLTYRTLNRRANQLAHLLRKEGVAPETLVGICLPRSLEMIIALLGILKAGGAYLPLDPEYPAERRAFMLEDSKTQILITESTFSFRFTTQSPISSQQSPIKSSVTSHQSPGHAPPFSVFSLQPSALKIIDLYTEQKTIAEQNRDNPKVELSPETLAYVIYTSGSTGRPKGVAITHGSARAFLCWAGRVFDGRELSGVLAATSVCFDLSVFEIFAPLSGGGTAVIAENVLELPRLPAGPAITLINTVPSAMRELLRAGDLPAGVRTVNLAGEPLPTLLVRDLYNQKHIQKVYDLYGPSEDTTYSTWALREPEGPATIGRPIDDTRTYILDEAFRPAGIKSEGELYLAGAGLARGYLFRPDRTAQRFLPDPFAEEPGQRMYRTGDRARYFADGRLEFLGRLDSQVKLRGFRIELGEIEAALMRHPDVQEAAVMLRDRNRDSGGACGASPADAWLAAYVTSRPESKARSRELKAFLKNRLPDYMVPAVFVFLEALPRTPNRKIDRRALPVPPPPEGQTAYAAPRTDLEKQLATLWTELLGRGRIGVHDDFFDLGGHSLTAHRILSRINADYGVRMHFSDLYAAPTVALIAQKIGHGPGAGAGAEPPVRHESRRNEFPLSFGQQRLWFLEQLTPGSALYHIDIRFEIRGRLEPLLLEQCFREIIRRHAALRTVFREKDGQAVQSISAEATGDWLFRDLRVLPEREREPQAAREMAQRGRRPFDLRWGPLARGTLVRLAERDYRLQLAVHHIVFDGWSTDVWLNELGGLYRALAHGGTLPPQPGLQYGDYALWQQEQSARARQEEALLYWKGRFAETAPLVVLPADRPRPAAVSHRGAKQNRILAQGLLEAVRELGAAEKATPFMVLLTAFQTLVFRHTGQTDVTIGIPIANRNRPELESLIGFFVNMLPIRVDWSDRPGFRGLLQRTRRAVLEAYAHQDLPFEKIVEVLNLERRPARPPLFQMMFVMQNAPPQDVRLPDLEIRFAEEADTGTSKLDLTVSIELAEREARVAVEYNTDLYEAATVGRILDHFEVLLQGIAADPDRRLADLPLLTGEELRRLQAWNATGRDYAAAGGVHGLLEAQARRAPDAVAAVFEDQHLTGAALRRRSERLARLLMRSGVRPETPVGIHLERSLDMLAALWGVLKAGGAYVPLDPTYPAERLAYMAQDAGVEILIAESSSFDPAFGVPGSRVIGLDGVREDGAAERGTAPWPRTEPEQLAYIIYTSGSTGRPKGAQVVHDAVINLLNAMRREPGLSGDDVFLAVTSLSFDIAALELYLPLWTGARLEIAARAAVLDGARLRRTLWERNVTAMQATPTGWQLLLDGEDLLPAGLKAWCGGEALTRGLAGRLQARGLRLWNLYGPTETTIWSAAGKVENANREISLGRPIDNTEIHVLDEVLGPAPTGAEGGLYIGGRGLSRGYRRQPGTTAEVFMPDPYGRPGARLYRTGDRARRREDGALEFLGRGDQQIKLRGFRIELGDIEAALQQCRGIRLAAVAALQAEEEETRLVAFAEPAAGSRPTGEDLRRQLQALLPPYMMPAEWVLVPALPLLPNGKVDRRRLAALERTTAPAGEVPAAPRTWVEQELAGCWAGLLKGGTPGLHDNFFMIGGHSLLATRVISHIRAVFKVELPLSAVFEEPTLSGLSRRIEAALVQGARVSAPPQQPVPRRGPLPLSFAQERLWFLNRLEPAGATYHIPLAVKLSGSLAVAALRQSFKEVIRRHEILRTRFQAVDGRPVQSVDARSDFDLPVLDLRQAPAAEQEAQVRASAEAEARRPFDLEQDPLLRACLLRTGDEEQVLLLNMHHIVSDAWSLAILTREISDFYGAFSRGGRSAAPEPALQYADYAAWQRARLTGETLAKQLAYWKERLRGAPEGLELPGDRPRPEVQRFNGDTLKFHLTPEIRQGLQERGRAGGATLYMTLLAAFKVLLHRYTGQSDLIVGTAIAGRNQSEFEGLIGCFVNTLVLRTDLSRNPFFGELLGRVRETALGAFAHQDLPFERLVEELHLQRDLSRTPLFQIMFFMQNTPEMEWRLPGIKAAPRELTSGTSRFDLSLVMEARDQGLEGWVEYSTDLYERAAILGLVDRFRTLLADLAGPGDKRLSQWALLTAGEKQKVLVEWNRTADPFEHALCVHQWFEKRARETPDALAAAADPAAGETATRHLTYGELNRRANRLAHYLRRRGVGPEALVGISVLRSLEMIVGLTGIMKAGGAYVPIDPVYPEERKAFIMADARLPLVLTQKDLADRLPAGGAPRLCLDAEWNLLEAEAQTDPATVVQPANLAYLTYTSGSTGTPKGVQNIHAGLTNLVGWHHKTFGITAADRAPQVVAIGFDAVVWELWPYLTAGASLHIVDEAVRVVAAPLRDWLIREAISIGYIPTPLTESILELPWPVQTDFRTLLTGGDQLHRYPAPGLRFDLVNAYGPNETTVISTAGKVFRGQEGNSPTIGSPLSNVRVYLLDAHWELAPPGLAGEIHLAGASLARGYCNRPEMTAEKFIPDPFGGFPGGRLYRTGDLGRHVSTGDIEFLGRMDFQVKMRGLRIELGEIETALSRHPQVDQAAVLVQEATPGDKRLVAYVAGTQKGRPTAGELRRFLKEHLPEYMIPAVFMVLERMPLTRHGKVDRRALPAPDQARPDLEADYAAPRNAGERMIAGIWREVLQLEKVGVHDNFFELGGNSLQIIRIHDRLKKELHREDLSIVELFAHPSIGALARFLTGEAPAKAPMEAPAEAPAEAKSRPAGGTTADAGQRDAAVIGMSGRFPGAGSVAELWQIVRAGREGIARLTDEELAAAGVPRTLLEQPRYVRAAGVVEDIESFDAGFFGFNPREAELMDPQMRLFMECAWEALENAGYDPLQYKGKIGLYAGSGLNTYGPLQRYADLAREQPARAFQVMILNAADMLATYTSYKLNLKGPSLTVQTACSTSLVAVHLAYQGLLRGECDLALAGGVRLGIPQKAGYLFEDGLVFSPDGHCRVFDRAAQGTVPASGLGIVVLKRLAEAAADGDRILAVIKGSAVNNDGLGKIGFTAPSVEGQVEVIRAAQGSAGVDAASIQYVEAHGTGTPLGDPIEMTALAKAFSGAGQSGFCAVGSLKANLGHLDAAAGVAGLIKTVLMLQHKEIPPQLHFNEPNPKIDFSNSPFYVNRDLREWRSPDRPRRAGVSSFGMGGTNAHVILEEAPATPAGDAAKSEHLLLLSARSAEALQAATANLCAFLGQHPDIDPADAAYTLQVGRRAFEHRRMLVCTSAREAAAGLQSADAERAPAAVAKAESRPLYFMFPGQGSQYANMGRGLYEAENLFRESVDQCACILQPRLGLDLREILYPAPGSEEQSQKQLTQTDLTQPALFVVEYGLARLLQSWGLQPQAMIGHSIGEYVAACLAEVWSLEQTLGLVAQRGRLLQGLPGGDMLSVSLGEEELRAFVREPAALAAVNGPGLCTLSGPRAAIEALERRFSQEEIPCRRLHTSHAFHSGMVEPILEAFRAAVEKVPPKPPRRPFVSNVTGAWITPEEAADPGYWVRHLRRTVRFGDGLKVLLQEPQAVLLEVGPGRTLNVFAKQQQARTAFPTLPQAGEKQGDRAFLLQTLGRLWLTGLEIDWRGFYGRERRRRVALPTYPFERQRYWDESPPVRAERPGEPAKKRALAEWFYAPYWIPSAVPAAEAEAGVWLVLTADPQAAARLRAPGRPVYTAAPGGRFKACANNHYEIDPQAVADYLEILKAVPATPQRIVYFSGECFDYYGLILLVQALGRLNRASARLEIVTRRAQAVGHNDRVDPQQAMLAGLAPVIAQEYPDLICRQVDLEPADDPRRAAQSLDGLYAELAAVTTEQVVAYRGRQRFVPRFEAVQAADTGFSRLRKEGVYLITGGLGRIGRAVARHLAGQWRAKLALTGRWVPPPREEWEHWLLTHGPDDPAAERIRFVQSLEAQGAKVLVLAADAADEEQMRAVLRRIDERFGNLHGVLHLAAATGPETWRALNEITPQDCETHLRAKVQGTRVLAELLRDRKPDFCVLFSSLASFLGGMGFALYAAANRFMDAFGARQNQEQATPWLCVNWDAWRFDERSANPGRGGMGSGLDEFAMSAEEGLQALQHVLSLRGLNQVLVSTGDLTARWERWVGQGMPQKEPAVSPATSLHPRSPAANAYAAPRNELEKALAGLWQELLGTQPIGVHDHFFELGGHSLLAAQMISRIRNRFDVELPLRLFFEAMTIEKLALAIGRRQLGESAQTEELAALLEEMEKS